MNKVVLLLLGFPRTGSNSLASALARLSSEQSKFLGIFQLSENGVRRHHELVHEILFTPLSEVYSESLTAKLKEFAHSESSLLILSDEQSSIQIMTSAQLDKARIKLSKLIAADVLFVSYVRSSMYRYPSWVLHHASSTCNRGTTSPSVRERRVRRTLKAFQSSECQWILREYREGCSTVDDFFTEVLRKDLPNFGESKFRRSLSPDFILGALKFIDQKGYHGMTPYDVAARFSEVDEIFTDPVRLHSTVEVALAYETAKLNQTLEEIVNFKFDPIIKPQFECTQLYLSKLGVQDVFQISTRRIDEIVAILSSADRELTDSAN